ncbi:hypothetical protein [Gallaecimonas xiamenensis]|uniref:hypothetical protein n=1 Tax=Gallaecimonas xiamenensis TaxID=1207039 RepID=UPI0012E99F2C|nr:hypothetical protein [Gallaecimonas xiamenensis]
MRIEARQMFRSNGLIDDLVLYAEPEEYHQFADFVGKAISSNTPTLMLSESGISIEIIRDEAEEELFTSLQNKTNEYFSMDDWNNRDILRIYGSKSVLTDLKEFLNDLAGWGEGYSYISEYSEASGYSSNSPEWRLHVEIT